MAFQGTQSDTVGQISIVLGRRFAIEPEYLETSEIQHELQIRGLGTRGDRRTLTGALRRRITDENRNPGAIKLYDVGMPREEFEYCNSNLVRLHRLLKNVSEDTTTHERFMTLFLHLHGRLGRIPSSPALDLSQVIYSVSNEYVAVYEAFIERVRILLLGPRQRLTMQTQSGQQHGLPPGEEQNARNLDSPSSNNVSSGETNVTNAPPTTTSVTTSNNPSGQPVEHVNVNNDRVANGNEIVSNEAGNVRGNPKPNEQVGPNGQISNIPVIANHESVEQRVDRNENEQPMANEAQANAQFGPHQIYQDQPVAQVLDNILNRLDRMSMGPHATMQPNDNARLSQHFNRPSEEIIAPILNNNLVRPPILVSSQAPISVPNNNLESVRQIASPRPQEFAPHNVHNSSRYMCRVPTDSYGQDRINSLPDSFGMQYNQHANENRMYQADNTEAAHRVIHESMDTEDNSFARKLDSLIRAVFSLRESVTEINTWKNSFETINNPSRNITSASTRSQPMSATRTHIYDSQPMNNTRQSVNNNSNVSHFTNDSESNHRYNSIHDRSNYRGQSSVPIHKWNWKFSADKNAKNPEQRDLAAFLKKLELYREAENLTYEQIHRKFHYLIEGSVYEWYMQYRGNFANWQQLHEGLTKQFTTPLTHFMKVAKLAARRQGSNETAMEYIASIQREFDAMGMYGEQEKISVIQNGLRPRLRSIAMANHWYTVQELDLHLRNIEVADELHNETEVKSFKRPFFPKRSVNAIDTEEIGSGEGIENGENTNESEDEAVVDCQAIRTKRDFKHGDRNKYKVDSNQYEKSKIQSNESNEVQTKKVYLCYNCKSDQHMLYDCDKPIERTFCLRCGAEGMVTGTCSHDAFRKSKNL